MFSVKQIDLSKKLDVLIKCCGNDPLNLLTSSLNLRTKNGKIQLITTDTVNFAYMNIDNAPNEEFDVFVNMQLIYDLVKKCKTEDIEFEVVDNGEDNYLFLSSGKGNYKIPILDRTKEFEIPEHKVSLKESKCIDLDLSIVNQMISFNKPFLSTVLDNAAHHYFIDDNTILSNNGSVICSHRFNGDAISTIFNQRLASVLNEIKAEKIKWYYNENNYNYFENDNISIYSTIIELTYPLEKTKGIANIEDNSKFISIGIDTLKSVLGKISLFVNPLQNNAISFNVDKHLVIKSLNANAIEEVDSASFGGGPFEFFIDGTDLYNVLYAIKEEDIKDKQLKLIYCKGEDFDHINITTENTVYAMGVLSNE